MKLNFEMYIKKNTLLSDGMEIKILIVVTYHLLLDRTETVKEFIGDFNNSVHLSMKASTKVVEILID